MRSRFCILPALVVLASLIAGCSLPDVLPGTRGQGATRPGNLPYAKKVRGRKLSQDEENRLLGAKMHNDMGLVEFQKKHYDLAAQRFRLALRLVPDYIDAMNNLGRSQYAEGKFGAALAAYEEALSLARAIEPQNSHTQASIHANIGDLHRQREDYDKAILAYQQVLKLQPGLPRAHYEMGNLYLKQGKSRDAKWHFSQTLELDARFNKALVGRAIANNLLGEYREAWDDVLALEEEGFEVNEGLRKAIIKGLREKNADQRFRVGG